MSKTAVLLGATGLTGSHLLERLQDDDKYQEIKIFTRNSTGKSHPKIKEFIVDMNNLEAQAEHFTGDDVFCCIGTTKSKTPDKDKYRQVDYGIPVDASKLAGKNNTSKFIVMSSMGAHHKSKIFYNRIKGEMERDVQFYNSQETYIFRPSLISGKRDEKRLGEKVAKVIFSIINPILPKKMKSIHPKTIASAMVKVAHEGYKDVRITSDVIRNLAEDDRNRT